MSIRIATLVTASAVMAVATVAAAQTMATGVPGTVEAEPILRVPSVDYRKEWVILNTFSLLADEPTAGAKELHTVYTERKNVDAFLKDGKFPDGAVLVKDVLAAETKGLTTGTASYAGKLVGRFIMVKDAKGKLGRSPRFGDGWGWAYFEGAETRRTVTKDYQVDCLGCHEPARGQDLIFLQGYPLLKK